MHLLSDSLLIPLLIKRYQVSVALFVYVSTSTINTRLRIRNNLITRMIVTGSI